MDVKGISNNNGFTHNLNQMRKEEPKNAPAQKDSIEISAEAKGLSKTDLGSKRLEEISQKIQNKFYESDAVIGKVADAILKEFQK